MPRLFLSNFDFENRLAGRKNRQSEARTAALSHIWNAVAGPDDVILPARATLEDARFLIETHERENGMTLPELSHAHWRFVPWGWDDDAIALEKSLFPEQTESAGPQSVAWVNSRQYSFAWEKNITANPASAWPIDSVSSFVSKAESFVGPDGNTWEAEEKRQVKTGHHWNNGWILKPNFSFAGRNQRSGQTLPTENDKAWMERILAEQKKINSKWMFIERKLSAVAEFGVQVEIPSDRRCHPSDIIGIVRNVVAPNGTWSGCEMNPDNAWPELEPHRDYVIESIVNVANDMSNSGYFGPAGFDVMVFQNPGEPETRVRPLQDINARWTMGRIALEWRRKLAPDRCAFWGFIRHKRNDVDAKVIADELRTILHHGGGGMPSVRSRQEKTATGFLTSGQSGSRQSPRGFDTMLIAADSLASLPSVHDIQQRLRSGNQ